MKYVYAFEEGNRDQKYLLGGKGANLAEMTNMGLPVPPGFTITTEACKVYMAEGDTMPDGLMDEVATALSALEAKMGKQLGDVGDPLLVSVRSGAPFSMPGMMDTVLNLGLNDTSVQGLAKQTDNERFAFDSYRRFVQMFGKIVLDVPGDDFEGALEHLREQRGVETDPELSADDLRGLVETYKGIVREHAGIEFPQDPTEQLRYAIDAVFRSWNGDRARIYRRMENIPDDLGTAVNVQTMAFGNKGDDSGTGVAFTRDPATGENRPYGDFLRNAQGEDVVAGIRVTEPLDAMATLAFPDEAGARTIGGVSRAPIVVVLLDELPTNTIVDGDGRLDARRFPGFGELTRDATWFENAYTVYDSTERAQPAIMDGNLPRKDRIPTSADHPNSIFSLFAKTHHLNVSEEATSICSRDLCDDERLEESYGSRMGSMSEDLGLVWLHVVTPPGIEAELASVSENWGDFGGGEEEDEGGGDLQRTNTRSNLNAGRRVRFEQWIDAIRAGRRPGLNFKHSLLPHVPWQFLPDGRRYRLTPNDVVPGLSNQSYNDQGQLDVLLQRHVLQTGFADLMLRELWRHLKQEGLWDDALIVVAADHGVAFERGRRDRRRLRRANAAEIAPIPLFVKAPGQRRGRIDARCVETSTSCRRSSTC